MSRSSPFCMPEYKMFSYWFINFADSLGSDMIPYSSCACVHPQDRGACQVSNSEASELQDKHAHRHRDFPTERTQLKVELISNTLLLKQQYKRQFACYKGHPIPLMCLIVRFFKSLPLLVKVVTCVAFSCVFFAVFFTPSAIPNESLLVRNIKVNFTYPSLWNIYPFSLSWQIFKSQNLLPDCQFYLELP